MKHSHFLFWLCESLRGNHPLPKLSNCGYSTQTLFHASLVFSSRLRPSTYSTVKKKDCCSCSTLAVKLDVSIWDKSSRQGRLIHLRLNWELIFKRGAFLSDLSDFVSECRTFKEEQNSVCTCCTVSPSFLFKSSSHYVFLSLHWKWIICWIHCCHRVISGYAGTLKKLISQGKIK